MNYEQWDKLANAYILVIGTLCVVYILRNFFAKSFKYSTLQLLTTIASIGIIYLVMLFEQNWHIWSSFGAKYSFNIALALVFVCFFVVHGRLSKWIVSASMLGYIELMTHLHHYQWADIISTVIVILPLLLLIQSRSAQPIIVVPSKNNTVQKKVG